MFDWLSKVRIANRLLMVLCLSCSVYAEEAVIIPQSSTAVVATEASNLPIIQKEKGLAKSDTAFTLGSKSNVSSSMPYTKIKPRAVIRRAEKLIGRRVCVWDPMGQSGEINNLMKDYLVMADVQGVQLELKSYVEEKIAIEDFRVGYCDAVVVTGLRVRPYNAFTGSIEAVQGLPDKDHMHMLIDVLSKPNAASLMVTQKGEATYEVAGIIPFGSVFGFVKDRSITNIPKLAGKKIAIFDYDKAEAKLVAQLGAKSDPSDVTNFAGKFNNGQVDIVFAPSMAYKALELYKGIGENGGIVNLVLAQVSLQVLIHPDRFPEGYGQASRTYVANSFNQYQKIIDGYDKSINPKHWLQIKEVDRAGYENISRGARSQMVKEGIYDARMMALMKKIRCSKAPSRTECALPSE